VNLLDRLFYAAMLTVSALLLFSGLVLAAIAGVSPILSGSIILVNNNSQVADNYHLFPVVYYSIFYILSLILFLVGWLFHPTNIVLKSYLIVSVVAWTLVLAMALVLYISFHLGWAGL
jgi:hypothetical protein